jgi:hypothetical protein
MATPDTLAPTFAEMLVSNGIGVSEAKLTLLPEPAPRPDAFEEALKATLGDIWPDRTPYRIP